MPKYILYLGNFIVLGCVIFGEEDKFGETIGRTHHTGKDVAER